MLRSFSMRKVLLALGVAAALAVACFPQNQCDFQFGEYCGGQNTAPCVANIIKDENGVPSEWESGPLTGTWLTYGHNMDWHMHLRDATGAELVGAIDHYEAQISPSAQPNAVGNQSSPCAGNLCEWNFQPDGTTGGWVFDVHNDTCAEYTIYVHVWMQPGTGGLLDAGAVIDASTDASEAGSDAGDASDGTG
jgi:hypothetical protein